MSTVVSFVTQEPIERYCTDPKQLAVPRTPEPAGVELVISELCNHQPRYQRSTCQPGYSRKTICIQKDPAGWTTQDLAGVLDQIYEASDIEMVSYYTFSRTFRRSRRDPARLTLAIRADGHHLSVVLPGCMPMAILGELIASSWKFDVTCYKPADGAYTFSRGPVRDPRPPNCFEDDVEPQDEDDDDA